MLLCSCVYFLSGLIQQNYALGTRQAWLKSVNNMHLAHTDILLERITKMNGKKFT